MHNWLEKEVSKRPVMKYLTATERSLGFVWPLTFMSQSSTWEWHDEHYLKVYSVLSAGKGLPGGQPRLSSQSFLPPGIHAWLNTTEMCFLLVLEAKHPKSRSQQGHTPSGSWRGEFVLRLFQLLVAQLSSTCGPGAASPRLRLCGHIASSVFPVCLKSLSAF